MSKPAPIPAGSYAFHRTIRGLLLEVVRTAYGERVKVCDTETGLTSIVNRADLILP